MKLYLITAEQKQEYTIAWLELNTSVGNFVIKSGHAPTLLSLSSHTKIKFCLTNGKHEIVTINKGIANITRTMVTILFSP